MPNYYTNERILECLRGREIGGGEGYTCDVRLADADVVVSSRSEFLSALAGSADVIGIAGSARIDLSGRDFTLNGRTIVSDRGIDGSPGGLLYTTDHGDDSPVWDGGSSGRGFITMRGDSRISGVRLRGPFHDYYDDPRYPGYVPLDSGSATERRRQREARYARGIRILTNDAEVDNCEIYGWSNQAINIGSAGTAYSPHLHHLYVHDCMMAGFGYGISIIRGMPEIEKCYFNATRHSVDGFGYDDCGYTLEDCVFGPSTSSHAVDMHCLSENGFSGDLTAGLRVEVRRCTFTFTHSIHDRWAQAIAFRGYPEDRYVVENTRFVHPVDGDEPVENVANSSYEPVPYRQVNVGSGWHDWDFVDNQYGVGEEKLSHVGAPVDLDAPYDGRPLISADRRRAYLHAIDSLQ